VVPTLVRPTPIGFSAMGFGFLRTATTYSLRVPGFSVTRALPPAVDWNSSILELGGLIGAGVNMHPFVALARGFLSWMVERRDRPGPAPWRMSADVFWNLYASLPHHPLRATRVQLEDPIWVSQILATNSFRLYSNVTELYTAAVAFEFVTGGGDIRFIPDPVDTNS